ncbi:hypothetical protein I4U23_019344 [Adineta vaga]|nr:hypothetical protein I4U23_019344 [Adineta vaga]
MLPPVHLLSNRTLNVKEYSTVKFDCENQPNQQLIAWRMNLRPDNNHRYYYINPKLRGDFLLDNEIEEKPRNVNFENDRYTIIFSNVRQWINSAFESIECVIYNDQKVRFENMLFYLHIYVLPYSFSLIINNISMENQATCWFHIQQYVNITCEIYSYPKSQLELILNNKLLLNKENIDCFNDDLSTIVLSNALCLSYNNWRVRVQISTSLYLTKEYNEQSISCSLIDFPHDNAWNYSTIVHLRERIGK